MRIVRIRPVFFRGFGDSEWIELDSNLVVIFGPTAYAKTGLAEAIEWLFHGKTRRRMRGEALSQMDHRGSYRNVHAPEGTETEVSVVVRLADGTEYELSRVLRIGPYNSESTITKVNGVEAGFDALNLEIEDVFCPVVAQDGLQDFIHARPKDRRDRISAALGLESIVNFKTTLGRARTAFKNDPPRIVRDAHMEIQSITQRMRSVPDLAILGIQWESSIFSLDEDAATITEALSVFLNINSKDWTELSTELIRRKADAEQRVFDVSLLRPPGRQSNLDVVKNQYDSLIEALAKALQDYASASSAVYTQNQLDIWKLGLNLVAPESEQCPVCESDTLTAQKQQELQERLDESDTLVEANKTLGDKQLTFVETLGGLRRDISQWFPVFANKEQLDVLQALFADDQDTLSSFLDEHEIAEQAATDIQAALRDAEAQFANLRQMARSPETINMARTVVGDFAAGLWVEIEKAHSIASTYSDCYEQFEPVLFDRVKSADEVTLTDTYIKLIDGWPSVLVAAEYGKLLSETLDLIRELEDFIQTKQKNILAGRGQDILDWYELLNPGANVGYSRMEVGTDTITLWASSYGVDMNAVACLSECQLNCLGLSIHFMRTSAAASPFSFIVLDDPVQSMDDAHTEAFCQNVIQSLMDRGLQVIVTSHLQGLVDSIWTLFEHVEPRRLRISEFSVDGPTIENAETLDGALRRARNLAGGNEDNRRSAVKTVRRCVELLIRDVCRDQNATPPPDRCTAGQMLPFFRNCQNTTVAQCNGLDNTIQFSSPAAHTEPGAQVPIETQILPHVDRIRQCGRALGII